MLKKLARVFAYLCVALLVIAIVGYHVLIRISPVDEPVYSGRSNAIQMPYKRIVLVRSEDGYGAIRLLRAASVGGLGNGVKYEAWYQPDGSADFMNEQVEYASGYAYEHYERDQIGVDSYAVTDVGSELNVKAGPLWVEWSHSNHLYPRPSRAPGGEQPPVHEVQIAATPWHDVEQVDLERVDLRWSPAKLAAD